MMVLPWGGWREAYEESEVDAEVLKLRKHFQLKTDSCVLMTLSRISPEKGIHLLLEALSILEEAGEFKDRDICLFVCGETAFMRGEAYGKKVRRAAEKLKGVRVFFPGYLPAFHKQVYFRLANLFVSPSVHESYGLTLVEAMQGGLPVLASDHYGVEEILEDSYGRAVSYTPPAERASNLATAVKELLSDRKELADMGARAKTRSRDMTFDASSRRLWNVSASADPGSLEESI
jgi:glycosyltransferase involved in cell wall biosynthesis